MISWTIMGLYNHGLPKFTNLFIFPLKSYVLKYINILNLCQLIVIGSVKSKYNIIILLL
jgi:hypothetical protein